MTFDNKRRLALVALSLTVIFWGAGFVITDICLKCGADPGLINSIRFVTAAVCVGIIFHKQIKPDKKSMKNGCIGGFFLFLGFLFQLMGLKYTTAASNGFFTASYVLFVPFLHWAFEKIRPTKTVLAGILIAVIGFFVLNFGSPSDVDSIGKENIPLGNLLTIVGAVFLAIHIVWSDYSLKRSDSMTITWIQLATTATLFVTYFFIAEFSKITPTSIDWKGLALPVAFVAVFGTAFAYPSQLLSQKCLSPAETSLILSTESVVGGIVSVLAGRDILSWSLVIGGILVTLAIALVEVAPVIRRKRKNNNASARQEVSDGKCENKQQSDQYSSGESCESAHH